MDTPIPHIEIAEQFRKMFGAVEVVAMGDDAYVMAGGLIWDVSREQFVLPSPLDQDPVCYHPRRDSIFESGWLPITALAFGAVMITVLYLVGLL